MSEKNLLKKLIDEVKKTNELLDGIQTSLNSIETEVGVLGDIKLDLEAMRSELASIATSRTRKPRYRARASLVISSSITCKSKLLSYPFEQWL